MNLPTLKVMACPVNAGRHPFHDSRWIVTSDAEVEWNTNEAEWRLKKGSLICEMRDCQNQEQLARVFSHSTELLEMLERMVWAFNVKDIDPLIAFVAIEQARFAIAKAKGEA